MGGEQAMLPPWLTTSRPRRHPFLAMNRDRLAVLGAARLATAKGAGRS